ncbi:hypothetical protein MAR_001252 [Mya arenaria]|uniref:B box-type domain-containing protein n=1 Tax=Mya arenaria TaxID=6604 RepID=A0ABY7FEV9_MYAAR|nr:hypothetical protein MAR_001252 [Mya arenaria]
MATKLSDSVLNSGDFEYDFPCTECQERALNSEAIYYCENCTRQFCGLCIKKHDQFYRGHQILGLKKRDAWGKVMATDKQYSLVENKHFKVKLKHDKNSCSISGITVLPGGEIVIADSKNRNLMLLSASYTVVGHARVPVGPWEICAVSDKQVAVGTVGWDIQFFHVQNKQLKMDRKIQMEHKCYYVSYSEGHLYVSSGLTVYQYTLAGQRVREIYKTDGWTVWGLDISVVRVRNDSNISANSLELIPESTEFSTKVLAKLKTNNPPSANNSK